MMDPLTPTVAAKRPKEVDRRLDVLERARRTPGVGGWAGSDRSAAVLTANASTPQFRAPSTGNAGPSVSLYVPPSGMLSVAINVQASIGIPVQSPAAYAYGAIEVGVQMSGANTYNVPDINPRNTVYRRTEMPAITGMFITDGATISNQIVYSGLNPGLTTLTLVYRAGVQPGLSVPASFVVSDRSLVVIPL